MNNFCLLPDQITKLKKDFQDQKVSVLGLMDMTSEARTELFTKYAGSGAAKDMNLAFEQKLILKNRVQGVVNLLSKLTASGKYKPETLAKLNQAKIEYRAKQQQRILSPAENEKFLEDLAEKTFGDPINEVQAKQLFDLHKQSNDLLGKYDKTARTWETPQAKADYGAAKVLEMNYTSELKGEGTPWREVLTDKIEEFKAEPYKPTAVMNLGADALRTISDNSIALVASVDNSFLGRQGIKVLMTQPSVWADGANQSFKAIFKELGGKNAMDALTAHIVSQPNYISGEYEQAGILAHTEEAFPTSLPEQVPGLGRLFKASEVAFKGSALIMRTGLYDLYSDMARNGNITMDKVQIEDLGKVVNSLTARGKWGKYGESPIVKLLLWAPRMMKANLDILTAHGAGTGLKTPFARKIAFKNWGKIMATLVITLGTINALLKKAKVGGVEFNPLSSDFGKAVIYSDGKLARSLGSAADFVGISSRSANGKTTFDFTGGLGSYVTLAAREWKNEAKSATTGIVTKYGTGFGDQTRFGAFIDFLTGKTTPIVGAAINFGKGKNYQGQKPTVGNTAYSLLVPISIQNVLGIFGVQTGDTRVDWNQSTGKELMQFKDKVGAEKFNQANEEYNNEANAQLQLLLKSPDYKAKSDEDKQKAVTGVKDSVKSSIFGRYKFKYKQGSTFKNQSTSDESPQPGTLAYDLGKERKSGFSPLPGVPALETQHTAQQAMIVERDRILADPHLTQKQKEAQLKKLQFDDLPKYFTTLR